jgi:hypothetical protein
MKKERRVRHQYLLASVSNGKKMNRELPEKISVIDTMLLIDEMWHTFILYTPDYIAFSNKYFGHYFGHAPSPTLVTKSQAKAEMINRRELELIVEFVWDELGERTVDRWFVTYPKNFSKTQIRTLQYQAAV